MKRLLAALAAICALTLSSAASCGGSDSHCIYIPATKTTTCQH